MTKITSMGKGDLTRQEDGLVVEKVRPELKEPHNYQVLLLNDDFTPMEFVVHVLETFFRKDRDQATQIMFHVHTQGKGLCGVFVREIAETKVALVNQYSRTNKHPLLCTMEMA